MCLLNNLFIYLFLSIHIAPKHLLHSSTVNCTPIYSECYPSCFPTSLKNGRDVQIKNVVKSVDNLSLWAP